MGKLSLRNQKREIDGTSPSGRFHYSSGWIHTLHNMFYTYGYVEARIRMPLGSKVWPAFWMAQESLQWGAEFDIGEYFGTAFHKTCTHTNGTSIQGDVELLHKGSSFDDWNIYGLRWGPDGFEMYLNGNIVNRAAASNVTDYPSDDMYLILNNGVPSQPPDDDTMWPNTVDFDYVRLYKEVGADGKLVGGPVHFGADAASILV